jgi:hypothetical protein
MKWLWQKKEKIESKEREEKKEETIAIFTYTPQQYRNTIVAIWHCKCVSGEK